MTKEIDVSAPEVKTEEKPQEKVAESSTLTLPKKDSKPQRPEKLKSTDPEKVAKEIMDVDDMTPDQIEEAAKKWGHIPIEDHKGDPSKWQNAEIFLRNSLRKSTAHVNQLKKQRRVIETQNKIIQNLKESVANQKKALEPKMKEAFETGDFTTFNKLRKEEEALTQKSLNYNELEIDLTQDDRQAREDEAQLAREWITKHNQYNVDRTFTAKVDRLWNTLKSKFPNATPKQILASIDHSISQSASTKIHSSTTKSPSNMGVVRKTKSYDSLTSTSKRLCDEASRHGVPKEDYVENASEECFMWGQKK